MHLGFSLFSEDVTFGEFTMQVYHVSATGSFVQVIYILCDDGDIVPLFQFGQKMMSLIGYGMQQLFSTLIIEVQYDFWIFIKGSSTCYLHRIILLPQPIIISECGQSALCTNASSSKYNYLLAERLEVRVMGVER